MIDASLKELSKMIGKDEKVLWFGKPNKKCFILESIFNSFLPLALVWGFFDFLLIIGSQLSNNNNNTFCIWPTIVFFAFHLMPVWIYLGGVATSVIRYKNTAYVITTKGVYISSGLITKNQEMKPFAELSHVNIHRGVFDQFIGVGDVVLSSANDVYSSRHQSGISGFAICNISDYEKVYKMAKELQTDVYSDTMYPNALRPENNPGYNTKYNKFESIDIENQ